jgi:hypothetical protein
MDLPDKIASSRAHSLRLIATSASVSAIGFPFAAIFLVPTAVSYVALPGTILFAAMAFCSVVCFLFCPTRPLFLKLIAFALMANAVFWALYCCGFYWIHLAHSSR